jgi:hypothetical protein
MIFCFEESSYFQVSESIQLLDYSFWAVNMKIYIQFLLIVLYYAPIISYTILSSVVIDTQDIINNRAELLRGRYKNTSG